MQTKNCHRHGFTLLELLVVIAIIAILASLLLPSLAHSRKRAQRVACGSNLKQIALGIQMYVDDKDDRLPGPVFGGATASYSTATPNELIYYIAPYLSHPPPSPQMVVVDVFVCPGYRANAPDLTSMDGRKCYLLNSDVDPSPTVSAPPFGYPSPVVAPLTLQGVGKLASPSDTYALCDVDKANVNPSVSWWTDLPYKPVHAEVRNYLYFDWHVEAN